MTDFHITTVGWDHTLVEGLCDRIAERSANRFSHIMHPRYMRSEWHGRLDRPDVYFLREDVRQPMPEADRELLVSLERDGVPTVHNMIMGDRIVSRLEYEDALRYATFLARQMIELFASIKPSVVIGGFDAIHGGIALAVARRMGIPWFALNFTTIPSGLAGFCERMSPAAGVRLNVRSPGELRSLAEGSLQRFESRSIQAAAYVAPPPLSPTAQVAKLPARFAALRRTIRKSHMRDVFRYTEERSGHSVLAAARRLRRTAASRAAVARIRTVPAPPTTPYILFGLHMQPESSIDVWAPFFSNQMWVIELLARSIPPTHRLLVKIHKSDIANHSREQLDRMRALPGVELVAPFVDTREFIERADLLILIQGTMGLEAALLGKPVIMLGESPVARFPSVSQAGAITELPALVRRKLAERPPSRTAIVEAFGDYLASFLPASSNNWTISRDAKEIDGYVKLFQALKQFLASESEDSRRRIV